MAKDQQNLTAKKRREMTWEAAFLAALSEYGVVTTACKEADISRAAVYLHREHHEDFAQAWENALQEAADRMEREVFRRAVEGVEEPVFGSMGSNMGTGQIGTVRKYSDTLLIFALKAARPDKYRDRTESKTTVDVSGLTDEQLRAILKS